MLRTTFALNKLFQKHVFAVKNSIGELTDPVAEYHDASLFRQLEVQLYVAVAVDVIVNVGMHLHVLTGVAHQMFLVLSHVGRNACFLMLQVAVLGPCLPHPDAPARMNGGEGNLAQTVMKHPFQQFVLLIRVAQPVAVGHEEHLAVDLRRQRLLMQNDATLPLQVVVGPDVVVAGKEMHLHAHVGQLAQLAEEARVAAWHHIFVFVPEVKDIAQQIDGCRLLLDAVKETHQASFLRPAVGNAP